MRPRKTENRDLPPGMYRRKRKKANGKVWEALYYRDKSGKDIFLGNDLVKAKLMWAELEAKAIPKELTTMKGIFDEYLLKIIPGKAARTQKDNIYELKQLRIVFDSAPIDAITPAMIAQYRDSRSAKTRANREIALLSHVCGFHAIRPPSPLSSGQAFQGHLATCSTAIRPGSRSAATQGWHC